MSIEAADYDDPDLARFLQSHLDDIAPTAPDESQHALDLSAMKSAAGFRLWVALVDDHVAGTVGLATVADGHEELKSMRTSPSLRGHGIGSALLDHAVVDAKNRGVQQVSLETGSMDFFAAARTLYYNAGFRACASFGTYPADDPNSVFMTLHL